MALLIRAAHAEALATLNHQPHMKRYLPLILSTITGLTLPAMAQDKPTRPMERLTSAIKASTIIGTTVKNPRDETLGKVTDFVLDVESGRIVAVIVSTGSFLGIGGELSAVPPTALQFNPGRDILTLSATKVILDHAPHFKSEAWPDFAHIEYVGGIYRAYEMEPYFMTAADNTARNVRDRGDITITPFDQGSSQDDMATTTKIRKDVIAEKQLSVNAHNVKIITLNGKVTLRGPVKTTEEKRAITVIAERLVGARNVDNQLEVLATTKSN